MTMKNRLDVNDMTKDQLKQHILMLAMELTEKDKEIKSLKEEKKVYLLVKDREKVWKMKDWDFVSLWWDKDWNIKISDLIDQIKYQQWEISTLKNNVQFLHQCLDDRDKSIALLQEEKTKIFEKYDHLCEVKELLRNVVVNLGKLEKLKNIVFEDDAKEDTEE